MYCLVLKTLNFLNRNQFFKKFKDFDSHDILTLTLFSLFIKI
jgi:hypothetical protein